MPFDTSPPTSFHADEPARVAVIGSGIAGSACAASLLRRGVDVTVFDKARGVGGRIATRRAEWVGDDGAAQSAAFDHGAPWFSVTRPRFRAVVDRAERLGQVAHWRQDVYASFPAKPLRDVIVPMPNMPAFCEHLIEGVPSRLGEAVTRLQREADGWYLSLAEGGTAGPFDQVAIAIPAAQAASLLAGHRDDWADAFAHVGMAPCWTLMAATDELDWPWDAAEPDRGPLALVIRNDRKPGRAAANGIAHWVAHATAAWSAAHLEDDATNVGAALAAALEKLLPGGQPRHWHHLGVQRWRYANLAHAERRATPCWWDSALGLGACGDSFGDGTVEAAWCSGDALADAVVAPRAQPKSGVLVAMGRPQEVH